MRLFPHLFLRKLTQFAKEEIGQLAASLPSKTDSIGEGRIVILRIRGPGDPPDIPRGSPGRGGAPGRKMAEFGIQNRQNERVRYPKQT